MVSLPRPLEMRHKPPNRCLQQQTARVPGHEQWKPRSWGCVELRFERMVERWFHAHALLQPAFGVFHALLSVQGATTAPTHGLREKKTVPNLAAICQLRAALRTRAQPASSDSSGFGFQLSIPATLQILSLSLSLSPTRPPHAIRHNDERSHPRPRDRWHERPPSPRDQLHLDTHDHMRAAESVQFLRVRGVRQLWGRLARRRHREGLGRRCRPDLPDEDWPVWLVLQGDQCPARLSEQIRG